MGSTGTENGSRKARCDTEHCITNDKSHRGANPNGIDILMGRQGGVLLFLSPFLSCFGCWRRARRRVLRAKHARPTSKSLVLSFITFALLFLAVRSIPFTFLAFIHLFIPLILVDATSSLSIRICGCLHSPYTNPPVFLFALHTHHYPAPPCSPSLSLLSADRASFTIHNSAALISNLRNKSDNHQPSPFSITTRPIQQQSTYQISSGTNPTIYAYHRYIDRPSEIQYHFFYSDASRLSLDNHVGESEIHIYHVL